MEAFYDENNLTYTKMDSNKLYSGAHVMHGWIKYPMPHRMTKMYHYCLVSVSTAMPTYIWESLLYRMM